MEDITSSEAALTQEVHNESYLAVAESQTQLDVELTDSSRTQISSSPEKETDVGDEERSGDYNTNAFQGQIGCFRYSFNLKVFIASGVLIWGFVICCLVHDEAGDIIADLQKGIVQNFSWLFIGAVCSFIVFMIYLLLHPKYGDIKLGKPDEEPKYSLITWYAMLFSAAYSPSLYFYGVAEAVLHFRDSVEGVNVYAGLSHQAQVKEAINMSWFHLGLAGLSIYCVVGLNIAFLANRHDFPITMRTCLYPIIGDHIHGVLGDIVDTSAVVATMFGLATSLGLGVMQINAGLDFLFDIESNTSTQIILIWIITLIATVSVTTGVDKGIKYLSQINFGISCFVLLWLFFAGDSFFLLNLFTEIFGHHFQTLPKLYAQTDALEQVGFDEGSDYSAWMQNWTVFYWGWWIAFSPFVGTFIAQISRGRTVRVFILGNMSVPAVFTAIWLTIMGGLGTKMEYTAMEMGLGDELCEGVDCDVKCDDTWVDGTITRLSCAPTEQMLFRLLEHYPFHVPIGLLCILGIAGYFVTSSDSGSFVIDMITSGGLQDAPKTQRVFWALSEGAAATALLAVGGSKALTALQTASIASALPFCVLLCIMVYCLICAFEMDEELLKRRQKPIASSKGFILAAQSPVAMEPITPTKPIENGFAAAKSDEIDNDNMLDTDGNQKWAIGFFDDVCSMQSMKMILSALLCPCFMQHRNGKSIGMDSIVLAFAVFLVPLMIFAMLIGGFFIEGLHSLAACIWVAFVVISATIRMNVREKYNIPGSFPTDAVSYVCCYCLALRQETVSLRSYDTAMI